MRMMGMLIMVTIGKRCVDQTDIYNQKDNREIPREGSKNVHREKAHEKVDSGAVWNVLKIHGVRGQLLEGITTFYRDASTCLKVHGRLGVFCYRSRSEDCMMLPW